MSLLGELKRRNVFRVATFYVVAAWVLLQAGSLLFETLGVPAFGMKLLLGLLILGFPLTVIFAWVFEITPDGLKRERDVSREDSIASQTASKLNLLIIGLLVVAIGLGIANQFGHRGGDPMTTATDLATPPTQSTSATATVIQSTRGSGADVSIAVLPFVNMSDEKANEYFSDGLTEELLNVLANVQGLRVIARTSSFAYKGKDVKIADVARELSVDNVLEGSVRKSGDTVRITTQLIRASDSSHLWSETYDRNLKDIFAVQDEISKHVVDALKIKLLADGRAAPEIGGTVNTKAYEAFLLGRHIAARSETEENLRASLAAYDSAIQLDAKYAQAYAGKGAVLSRLASNGYEPFDTGFARSRDAAQESLKLEPNLADGYLTLAFTDSHMTGRVDVGRKLFERALQLNPGSALVQQKYAEYISALGEHETAIAASRRAIELDPISADVHASSSGVYSNARRYAESEAEARRALELAPEKASIHSNIAYAVLLQGRLDEACEEFAKDPIDWSRTTGRLLCLAMSGKKDLARRELAAFQKVQGESASFQYAQVEAQLGDRDAVFRWLENARRVRDPGLLTGLLVDPLLDPIRDDPRYRTMLKQTGLAQ